MMDISSEALDKFLKEDNLKKLEIKVSRGIFNTHISIEKIREVENLE